jgi:hypothetical protein
MYDALHHPPGAEPSPKPAPTRSPDKEQRMRRTALLVLCLAMSGCDRYVGSPFDGFGGFIADTHTVQRGPNAPLGDSENMRRVRGIAPSAPPLAPQPGNVWPGPVTAEPTLSDIIKETPQLPPGGELHLPGQRGALTPEAMPAMPSMPPAAQPAPPVRTLQTPQGPATVSGGPGVQTYTSPTGATGLVVPNGNGTSTLIGPDGSVQTVPTPK